MKLQLYLIGTTAGTLGFILGRTEQLQPPASPKRVVQCHAKAHPYLLPMYLPGSPIKLDSLFIEAVCSDSSRTGISQQTVTQQQTEQKALVPVSSSSELYIVHKHWYESNKGHSSFISSFRWKNTKAFLSWQCFPKFIVTFKNVKIFCTIIISGSAYIQYSLKKETAGVTESDGID